MTTPTREELRCLESAYIAMLHLPDGFIRITNQLLLCGLRDALAAAMNRSEESVQNEYEARSAALLQAPGEPQSSDQVWNEAIEAAIEIANGEKLSGSTNSPRDAAHEVAVDGVVRSLLSLKRPSQAQEPSPDEQKPCRECDPSVGVVCDSCASVSGAVDEREPMFWVRLRSDGGYEGPIHNDAIEKVRKLSGVWKPLYLALSRAQATQPAQQDIAEFEALAAYQGLQDFTKAADKAKRGDIPATHGGKFSPATYYNFVTELAYRVWANKNAAPAQQAPVPWDEAQRICDLPAVDEAIRNLLADNTGDNATCMVRAILEAAAPVSEQPLELRICETQRLVLQPNRPYIFTVDPHCEECKAHASMYDMADKTAATVQPVEKSTADHSLDSALLQMKGMYSLMMEFKVPPARAANTAAHIENAIRHLHRLASTAAPQPQAAQSEDSRDAAISDVSDLCRHGELAERIYGLSVRTIGMAIRQSAPDESLLFHIKRLSDHLPTRHRQLLRSHIEWHEAGRKEEPQRSFVQSDAALAQAGKEGAQ
jgi:hypothetical protein